MPRLPVTFPTRLESDTISRLFESGLTILPLEMKSGPSGRVVRLEVRLPRAMMLPPMALEVSVRAAANGRWLPVMGINTRPNGSQTFGLGGAELDVHSRGQAVLIHAAEFWPSGPFAEVRIRTDRDLALKARADYLQDTGDMDAYFDVGFVRRVPVVRVGM